MTDRNENSAKSPPFLTNVVPSVMLIGILKALRVLPYRWRVPVGGFVVGRLIAPLTKYRERVRNNLDLVMPDMPEAEKRRLEREVPSQWGRMMTELFSPQTFIKHVADAKVTGDGVDALEEARLAGRPIIIVSGHIGNYDAVRAWLVRGGHRLGSLYRKLRLERFNSFYESQISQIGSPLFPTGRRGLAEMIQHLRKGNTLALLIDQHLPTGQRLQFFGRPTITPTSAADMALKYDALLVPTYGIRQSDGLSYEVIIEAPIPHSTPNEMMQQLNDSLEVQVRAHMEQWLWTHRRWKLPEDND